MTRISTLDVDYCDVCFLDDGRVAALYASNVDLVDRRGNVLTVGGVREPCGAYTRISARGNLIYVSDHSGVAVYELDYEIVVPQAMIKLEGIDQIEAIAGGRLAALGGGSLHIAGANAVPAWIRLPDDAVLHLCPLPDGMAWLALEDTRGEQGPGPERITLAPVDDPLKPRLTINVAPWTVWDLAATPTAVAALLHHLEPGAREPQGRDLVIYGTDGRERWRTPVDKTDMNAFVALGDTRVVVVRGDRKLDAWDVATGARVPVA